MEPLKGRAGSRSKAARLCPCARALVFVRGCSRTGARAQGSQDCRRRSRQVQLRLAKRTWLRLSMARGPTFIRSPNEQ